MKKIAVVDLIGGFGNQVAQISLCKFLHDHNFRVFVNPNMITKTNEEKYPRSLEIDLDSFGFKKMNGLLLIFFDILKIIFEINFLKKIMHSQYNYFFKVHKGQHFKSANISFLNRFTGYWQGDNHIYENIKYIEKALSKHANYEVVSKDNVIKNKFVLHIRKGDYKDISEELSMKYYINAINFFKEKYNVSDYDIFSDEKELVKNKVFNDAKNLFLNDGSELSIETFSRLSKYKYIAIANSSFSYLSAMISQDIEKIVTFPSPWFQNNDFVPKIIPKWKEIKY
tara:strand:+ start:3459 stop:4307 length:849 start_codon:yes stop_codon:yes gene_type:complete